LQTAPWVEKYRPHTCSELIGNEEAVSEFKSWLKATLEKRNVKRKACLLTGPPGVGKTSLARAAADDFHLRIVELNASDVRTEKAIQNALVPASISTTLDTFSSKGHGNLILLDEVDGVFGREDRGGLGAILSAIEDSPVPIVLTANNVENERFDDLRKECLVIELMQIRPRLLLILINHIIANEHTHVASETVNAIIRRAAGDIRSAINDVQSAAAGTFDVWGTRTKQLDEEATVKRLFSSHSFGMARRILNETELPLYKDELLLLLSDLLPYVYTSATKLAQAYEMLSRADIAYARVGVNRSRGMAPPPFNMPRRDSVPQWNLLPVALNELASVGIQQEDNLVEQALKMCSRPSLKTIERYQYRLWSLDHVCRRLARTCHVSKRIALRYVLPTLVSLFRANETYGREVATAMQLEERDIAFLSEESKSIPTAGPSEMLDPAGFKLAFMGKDKFIQLMRIGIKYDSKARKFSVRRMDHLDSVEESLSQILGTPVKFLRPKQERATRPQSVDEGVIKLCHVDGNEIPCDLCTFVDVCPTHLIPDLKYCLCAETIASKEAYTQYISKPQPEIKMAPKSRRKATKKIAAKKKS
jgi:replication factor C large subunit